VTPGDRAAAGPGGFCRDCGHDAPAADRCPSCASPRILAHAEIDELAIAHVDCDAFYAAIEKRDRPELADRPVIVGGGRRGVVSAACYIARIHGVHSAMPMFKALEACPDAVVIHPDMAKYAAVGREIREMMRALTPLVEPLSIDEAFLDLSGTSLLHGASPARTLARFAARVEREVGITVSIGLSHNKFLAKIASDLDKPRGFCVIGRAETDAFLEHQPVGIIWGVGRALQRRLADDGYRRIADLRRAGAERLTADHGTIGARLAALAWGRDARAVQPRRQTRSISAETTFDVDICDAGELETRLWRMCEKVAARAKSAGHGGRTVTLKLKRSDFTILTRNARLASPTQLAATMFAALSPVLGRLADGRPYRLLGAGLSDLGAPQEEASGELFAAGPARAAKVEAAMDEVRARFGPRALDKGRALSAAPLPARSRALPGTRDRKERP
jgi:DNA polymerase-4